MQRFEAVALRPGCILESPGELVKCTDFTLDHLNQNLWSRGSGFVVFKASQVNHLWSELKANEFLFFNSAAIRITWESSKKISKPRPHPMPIKSQYLGWGQGIRILTTPQMTSQVLE